MSWETIITILISVIGLGLSLWATAVSRKTRKETLRQSAEFEINKLKSELSSIDVQIAQIKQQDSYMMRIMYTHQEPEDVKILMNKRKELVDQIRKLEKSL